MLCKVAVFLVVVGVTMALPHSPHPEKLMPYKFGYEVSDSYSGQYFDHKEHSDGTVVKGKYSVDLPDGRQQTVEYRADPDSGYQVDVSYRGPGQHQHDNGHHH